MSRLSGRKPPCRNASLVQLIELGISAALGLWKQKDAWNEVQGRDATKEETSLLAPISTLVRQHERHGIVLAIMSVAYHIRYTKMARTYE